MIRATFQELEPSEKQGLNVRNGVKIVKMANGVLRSQGMNEGFVILKINRKPVTDATEVAKILNQSRGRVVHIEGVNLNGDGLYYYFTVSL